MTKTTIERTYGIQVERRAQKYQGVNGWAVIWGDPDRLFRMSLFFGGLEAEQTSQTFAEALKRGETWQAAINEAVFRFPVPKDGGPMSNAERSARGGLVAGRNMTPEERSARARKAGLARAAKLTPEERSAIARHASETRHAAADRD